MIHSVGKYNPDYVERAYPATRFFFVLQLAMSPHIDISVRLKKNVGELGDASKQAVFDCVYSSSGYVESAHVAQCPAWDSQREL